jgi:hypothetical protein
MTSLGLFIETHPLWPRIVPKRWLVVQRLSWAVRGVVGARTSFAQE